jgi:hypothetical protein
MAVIPGRRSADPGPVLPSPILPAPIRSIPILQWPDWFAHDVQRAIFQRHAAAVSENAPALGIPAFAGTTAIVSLQGLFRRHLAHHPLTFYIFLAIPL